MKSHLESAALDAHRTGLRVRRRHVVISGLIDSGPKLRLEMAKKVT
jgi:hypothetical protein